MPRGARDSDACLWHVSIVSGARRRGWPRRTFPVFATGPLAPGERKGVLEGVLGGHTNEWVIPREARAALRLPRAADRFVDAFQRQVGERVGAQLGGHLGLRAVVGDHLLARRHVDAVVAGEGGWGRREGP